MKTTTIFLLLFILLLFSISAQEELPEEPAMEETPYDYTDANNYENPDFYRDLDSDPSKWDWSEVDWNLWDMHSFERADLYDVPAFYDTLPAWGYHYLNYRLVDYGLVSDHSRIDGTEYAEDFGCSDCQLYFMDAENEMEEFGEEEFPEEMVRYTKEGEIFHDAGDHVVLGLVQSGATIRIDSSHITVFCAPATATLCVPEQPAGEFFISTREDTLDYEGNSISGVIKYTNGRWSLAENQEVIINDIEIRDRGIGVPLDLYFDGLDHGDNYLSINTEDGIVRLESSGALTGLQFLRHNGIFTMLGGEHLFMRSAGGSAILIESRRAEGLIPRVTIHNEEAMTTIENGNNFFYVQGDTVEESSPEGQVGSVSFTLTLTDKTGNPILGSAEQPEKIIFDRSNNFVLVPIDVPEEDLECYLCAVDLSQSSVIQLQSSQQIQERFGIDFEDETGDAVAVNRLLHLLEELTPEMRESVQRITLVPDEEMEEYCGENTGGCASGRSQSIVLPQSLFGGVLPHEVAHTRAHEIFEESRLEAVGIVGEIADLVETYGSLENAPESARRRVERLFQESQGSREVAWEQVVGENFYDTVEEFLAPGTVGHQGLFVDYRHSATWRDGSFEPRYGCFSAYACNNIQEDIAESAEIIHNSPQYVRSLINPQSVFYQILMGEEIGDTDEIMTPEIAGDWARRYWGRVEFLHDNEFITDEDYETITRGEEQ